MTGPTGSTSVYCQHPGIDEVLRTCHNVAQMAVITRAEIHSSDPSGTHSYQPPNVPKSTSLDSSTNHASSRSQRSPNRPGSIGREPTSMEDSRRRGTAARRRLWAAEGTRRPAVGLAGSADTSCRLPATHGHRVSRSRRPCSTSPRHDIPARVCAVISDNLAGARREGRGPPEKRGRVTGSRARHGLGRAPFRSSERARAPQVAWLARGISVGTPGTCPRKKAARLDGLCSHIPHTRARRRPAG